jgi:hypothetical protein
MTHRRDEGASGTNGVVTTFWKEAGYSIERFLPGSLPHAQWTLRLIAANPGESMAVIPLGRRSRLIDTSRARLGCRLSSAREVRRNRT